MSRYWPPVMLSRRPGVTDNGPSPVTVGHAMPRSLIARHPHLALMLLVLIWGVGYPIMKIGLAYCPPLLFAGWYVSLHPSDPDRPCAEKRTMPSGGLQMRWTAASREPGCHHM